MSKLRISDAPLLPDVNGSEKIPTGGRGDLAISMEQVKTFAQGGLPQQINAHVSNTENPHSVTKVQVGLGEVDNTSDVAKPISTATQEALDLKANTVDVYNSLNLKADKNYVDTQDNKKLDKSEKGVSGGLATLDESGKVPRSELPSFVDLDVTVPTYKTVSDGVHTVTGVPNGAYFNVRSSLDESYVDEYQNVSGVAIVTGKSYLSALGVQLQEKPASTIKDASGKNQQTVNNIALDPNLAPLGWTQKDFNDTFVDVRKFIKKDMSNATVGFQNAVEAAYGGTLIVPIPLKLLDTIYVNKGLKIKGVRSSASNYATDLPLLDFSGLGANKHGIYVAESSSVIGFGLEGFYAVGNNNGGTGIKLGTSLSVNCADYNIQNGLFRNFSVGVEQAFAWDGNFRSMRVQGCRDGIRHANQVNAILYSQCAVVGSSNLALSFINAEGVQFDACDISNCSKTDGAPINMFQSCVTFNTPYFENIANENAVIRVGSASEVVGSTLQINNPLKLGRNIEVASNLAYVEINGRDRNNAKIVGASLSTQVNGKVTAPVNHKANRKVAYWDAKKNPTFNTYGGVAPTVLAGREFATLSSTSGAYGITLTNSLVVGDVYTLRIAMRRGATFSSLGLRQLGASLSLIVDANDVTPSVKNYTFVAEGTSLAMTFNGDIELFGYEIISGNISTQDEDVFSIVDYDGVIAVERAGKPTAGVWKTGDTVKRSPTNTNPITEYVYQSSNWRASKWVVLSLATTALPALTQYDTGVEVYDTTVSTFKRWNGASWV